MRVLFTRMLCAFVLFLVAGYPQHADACACCDGGNTRTLVGWSKTGNSALIDSRSDEGCEKTSALEVWQKGKQGPAHCFDNLSPTPNKKVACDSLFPEFAKVATPGKSKRAQFFPEPAQAISAMRCL